MGFGTQVGPETLGYLTTCGGNWAALGGDLIGLFNRSVAYPPERLM